MHRLAYMIALVALVLALTPALARADGDPASDVLLEQTLFLPADAGVPANQAAELNGLLESAAHSGYSIRVALISGPADLGSITALWRQPATYAHFLDTELSLAYQGRVLVVMPNGFGLSSPGALTAGERSALAGLPAPGSGAALATAATQAVRRLASAAGHPLSAPTGATGAPGAPAAASSTDLTAWIVFVLGGILIVAAWTLSLRARPVRLRGPGSTA